MLACITTGLLSVVSINVAALLIADGVVPVFNIDGDFDCDASTCLVGDRLVITLSFLMVGAPSAWAA
jgi:hypothetical protein